MPRIDFQNSLIILFRLMNIMVNALTGFALAHGLDQRERGTAAIITSMVSVIASLFANAPAENIIKNHSTEPSLKKILRINVLQVCVMLGIILPTTNVIGLYEDFAKQVLIVFYCLFTYIFTLISAFLFHAEKKYLYQLVSVLHVSILALVFFALTMTEKFNLLSWLIAVCVTNLLTIFLLILILQISSVQLRIHVNSIWKFRRMSKVDITEFVSVNLSSQMTQILLVSLGCIYGTSTAANMAIVFSLATIFMVPISPFIPVVLQRAATMQKIGLPFKENGHRVIWFFLYVLLIWKISSRFFELLYSDKYNDVKTILPLVAAFSVTFGVLQISCALLRGLEMHSINIGLTLIPIGCLVSFHFLSYAVLSDILWIFVTVSCLELSVVAIVSRIKKMHFRA